MRKREKRIWDTTFGAVFAEVATIDADTLSLAVGKADTAVNAFRELRHLKTPTDEVEDP